MGGTSYDKVAEAMCTTDVWKSYVERVRDRLKTYRMSLAAFDVREDVLNPKPYFRTTFDGAERRGEKQEFSVWRSARHELHQYKLDWDNVNPTEELIELAKHLWTRVPRQFSTYNCKLEKTEKGPRGQNYVTKHFPDFARQRIVDTLSREHEEASDRVRQAMTDFYDLPGFEERKAAAVERTAINDIRGALSKYRHLEEHVLRTAFMEFIAAEVLES